MNIDEARQAFSKFEVKHPRNDDFNMNDLQANQYEELFENSSKEDFVSLLSDLFNYGFMAGYKQSEKEHKEAAKRTLDLSKDVFELKEKLLRLIYDMPWYADKSYQYLYSFIVSGMTCEKPWFPMSIGHEKEIAEHAEQYQ